MPDEPPVKTKALSPAQNETAREMLRKLLNERYEGHQGKLAKALGIQQAFLSEILSGKRGVGIKLLAGLEKLTDGSSVQVMGFRQAKAGASALGRVAQAAVAKLVSEGVPQDLADFSVRTLYSRSAPEDEMETVVNAARLIAGALRAADSLVVALQTSTTTRQRRK